MVVEPAPVSIAGTFQRRCHCPCGHRPQIGKRQRQFLLDCPDDAQPPVVGVDLRHRKVIADIEEIVGRDKTTQRCERKLKIVRILRTNDECGLSLSSLAQELGRQGTTAKSRRPPAFKKLRRFNAAITDPRRRVEHRLAPMENVACRIRVSLLFWAFRAELARARRTSAAERCRGRSTSNASAAQRHQQTANGNKVVQMT